ncbi:MAG: class I SAM-dependent methyltransferase [Opitutaceae bacterium]|jgi:demethylmenaquinone methyltransferase/2-methoxy-6-polyprenyl-1,4-benzoquinol methylase|nr:class I SAM-dependent methyltransferase [Opitutaceae bacterium]
MPDPVAVNSMFARIARRYDAANRLLSGGMDVWWRHRLVRAVRRAAPSDVLDLATGSGDAAFALCRGLPAGTRITGVDFCQPMLDRAEEKKRGGVRRGRAAYGAIAFRRGDGMALPFAGAAFDAVTIAFGLRNMADRHRSLSEMHRVLRPGGRVFVLEFSQPWRWLRPFYYFYLRHLLPRIAGLVTGDRAAYDYLNQTIAAFPARPAMEEELRRAGFAGVRSWGMTCGIAALHRGTRTAGEEGAGAG